MKQQITIKEYDSKKIYGIETTQVVNGKERGGYVVAGFFYYPESTNSGIFKVPAHEIETNENVTSEDYQNRANEG